MPLGATSLSSIVSQARWLRERYVAQHLRLSIDGTALRHPGGEVIGYLEELALIQNRLLLRGWARARAASFRLGPVHRHLQPKDERLDVGAAFGCDPHVGFATSLPFHQSSLRIEIEALDGTRFHIDHLLDIEVARIRSERQLRRKFLRDVTPLIPMIVTGLTRRDSDLRRKVKTALRLDREVAATLLDPDFLAPSTAEAMPASATPPVTIILPVHNAFALLPEALERIVTHTDLPWHLVVIEDASTDPLLRPWLRDWVAKQPNGQVTLIENATNQGFIHSVNRGLEMAQAADRNGPIILMNSDAMVPPGWASRLIAPLVDAGVASVTPLSNDAEILSAPFICQATPLAPGQGDAIDASLRARIATDNRPDGAAPTGVGFCMAINRAWLGRIGSLDPRFGRGYGEEVDWCRRATAKGARHVTAANLFVEHRGGSSFGPEKTALVQQNNAIIAARYPGYDAMVQDFIRQDPLITPRLVAALAWADSHPEIVEVPVYIAHSMGGGAEDYLRQQRRELPCTLTLRLGGAARVQIEMDTPQGRLLADTDDLALVVRLIGGLRKRRVIYSCAVGDPDLRAVPGFLIALAQQAPLDILFHDYLPISPSYTLLDADGTYRGLPLPGSEDAAHHYTSSDGSRIDLAAWQALWSPALAHAAHLVTFSEASAQLLAAAYPAHADRIIVRPHRITAPITRVTPPKDGPRTIGILGAIGPQKGAAVVAELSRALAGRKDIRLVLIGHIAPGYDLAPDTIVHGRYDVADIATLASHYGVTEWLIPSIWPETFSFTTHECLATGLPTMAFDLGAQGEAVRKAENGVVVGEGLSVGSIFDALNHTSMLTI